MDIIAHRGASGAAPENTLAAFELAWSAQADGIEIDVRMSKDRRIMVHHDADTQRTAGAKLMIASSMSSQLRSLDVGHWKGPAFAGQCIPFLEEVLTGVPVGKKIFIEIKSGPEIASILEKTITACNITERSLNLISFNLDTLAACRTVMPNVPCYPVIQAQENGNGEFIAHSRQIIALARDHSYTGLDPQQEGITEDFAVAMRAADLKLITWTVNDAERCRTLYHWGLDAITTDWPAEMRQALA